MSATQTKYTQHPPAEALERVGRNGRIGLVALATDVNSEADLRRMAPAGVEIFTNRVRNRNPTTVENLRAMAPDITRAAGDLLPGDAIDVLIYACTSGTAVIGEDEVFRRLRAERGELPCTTPATAALAAFAHLRARRISMLTPYIESVNRELAAFFHGRGVEVLNVHGFGIESDADMTGVSHASIVAAARDACDADADLLFISCTALRAAEVIGRIETELGKPVISSNQAMLWHALRLIGRPFAVNGFGSLFDN
ncbi:MAG: maleate cis-trans isomerase family protein [bacterium]